VSGLQLPVYTTIAITAAATAMAALHKLSTDLPAAFVTLAPAAAVCPATGVFVGADALGAAVAFGVAFGAAVATGAASLALGAAVGAAVGELVGAAVIGSSVSPAAVGSRVLCSRKSMLSRLKPVTLSKQTVSTCGPAGISIAAAL
jgi:hypothetical protein